MSDYKEYMEEKERLDTFLEAGYAITAVNEYLSGMSIEFTSPASIKETVLLTTADARKYISTIMLYS